MDNNGKSVYPELQFSYMVFQPYPQKNFIWYYLDGANSRRILNLDSFYQMVKDHWPDLYHDVYEACRSTSFFLLNVMNGTVTHLSPQANHDPYIDNIHQLLDDKKMGRQTKHLISEKKSVEDVLMNYGFNVPTTDTVKNLKVSIEKKDNTRDNFISRFVNRNRRG